MTDLDAAIRPDPDCPRCEGTGEWESLKSGSSVEEVVGGRCDCGVIRFTNAAIRERIKKKMGPAKCFELQCEVNKVRFAEVCSAEFAGIIQFVLIAALTGEGETEK